MPKILLLEPDQILSKTYSDVLEACGYEVKVAKSAQTALQSADESPPDLIIVELQMSEHNGLEFLYEFRSYPEWQAVPAVLLSIVPLSQITDELTAFRSLGVVDYLYKPVTKLQHIVSSVERLLPAPA